MSTKVSSMELGPLIIKALGLPSAVKWLELRLELNTAATVVCEINVTDQDGKLLQEDGELVTALKRYELVEKDSS